MPGNKLLAELGGKPVIRRVAESVRASRASSVIVVTGNEDTRVRLALREMDVRFAHNVDFAKGLSESLKCGLKNAADCDGAMILLGDMPFVLPDLINNLIEAFDPAENRAICVPVRNGRRGNPVLWARSFFPELLTLEGDHGAKRLFARHEDAICEVAASDDGVLFDIDTAQDLKSHE